MTPRTTAAGPPGWKVWLGLATVYLVWGSTYLAIRVMVETVPPLLGAGARFLLAGVGLYLFLLARFGWARVRAGRRELAGAALVGVLLPAGGNGLVTVAEQDIPSALAALIIASIPLWVVLLRRASGERIAGMTGLGVGLGFAGVAVLMLPGNQPAGATAIGYALMVIAAVSWATGSFLSGRLGLPSDPLVSTALQMTFGGVALAIAGLALGELPDVRLGAVSGNSLAAFLYLVFIGSLVAYTAYVWLLQNVAVSKVATYAYVNPVVAVVLGWAILSESISATTLIGATVIVASVALVVGQESGPRRAPAPRDARRAVEPAPEPTG